MSRWGCTEDELKRHARLVAQGLADTKEAGRYALTDEERAAI